MSLQPNSLHQIALLCTPHGEILQRQGCLLTARGPDPRLALTLATNPGSQPYRELTCNPVYAHSWLKPLLLPALIPQPLKASLRTPTALAATVDPLPSSPGTTMLLMLWPELSSYHISLQPPYLEPCTIRWVTVHSGVPLLTGEGLSLQKSVHEAGKR